MSTTSMAIFSNPLFATYSVYACNASNVGNVNVRDEEVLSDEEAALLQVI